MSDTQLTILISALGVLLGGLGATLRWAVNRVTLSMDSATAAILKHAEAAAVLSTKIDSVSDWVESHPTPALGTQLVDMYPPPELPKPPRTPVGGVPIGTYGPTRAKTRNEDR